MNVLTKIAAVALFVGAATIAVPAQAHAATSSSIDCVKRTLRLNTKNDCVGHVQTMLNKAGGASLKVDNNYGTKTKAAVIKWQQSEQKSNSSMLVDGVVGKQTWATFCAQKAKYTDIANSIGCSKLPAAVACTKQTFSTRTNYIHPCVGTLQMMVNLSTDAQLKPDNNFGTKTRTAVKEFQTDKKIKDDGIVGPRTWQKLCSNKMSNSGAQDVYNKIAKTAGCKIS